MRTRIFIKTDINFLILIFSFLFSPLPLAHGEVPITHLKGIDKLFDKGLKEYSLLRGAISRNNNFIKNIHKYGDEGDPAVKLARSFFNSLPTGELIASSLNRNPASHLGPSTIGKIVANFHKYKNRSRAVDSEQLAGELVKVITSSPEYQQSLRKTEEKFQSIKAQMAALDELSRKTKEMKAAAEVLDNESIKPLEASLKKAKDKLKKASKYKTEDEIRIAKDAITEDEGKLAHLRVEYENLKKELISNKEYRESSNLLNYEYKRYDTSSEDYQLALKTLASNLTSSFIKYDLYPNQGELGSQKLLPQNSTTDILLSFLWAKANNKGELKGYVDEMKDIGVIKRTAFKANNFKEEDFYNDYYTDGDWSRIKRDFLLHEPSGLLDWYSNDWNNINFEKLNIKLFHFYKNPEWIYRNFADLAALKMERPANTGAAPVFSFRLFSGYKSWIFGDCAENSLRVLLGLALYKKDKGILDHTLLERLKLERGIDIKEEVIEFFRKNPEPMATKSEHYDAWNAIASDLNPAEVPQSPPSKEDMVEYKWGRTRERPFGVCEITGGFKSWNNAAKRLLGNLDAKSFITAINALTGRNLIFDDSHVDGNGHGDLYIKDGSSLYHWNFGQIHVTADMVKSKDEAENFSDSSDAVIKNMDQQNINYFVSKRNRNFQKSLLLTTLDINSQLDQLASKRAPLSWELFNKNDCDAHLQENFSLPDREKLADSETVKWNTKIFQDIKDQALREKILSKLVEMKLQDVYHELFSK